MRLFPRVSVALGIAGVLLLAGCSSGRSPGSVGTGSTGSVSTTGGGATSTTVGTGSGSYLRGIRLSQFGCPSPAVAGVPARVPVPSVTTLMLCPLGVPNPSAGTDRTVTLGPSEPAFRPLVLALAAPDALREARPCPLFADVLQPVVARAGDLALLVHLPVDGCGHYQAAVRAALARARAA